MCRAMRPKVRRRKTPRRSVRARRLSGRKRPAGARTARRPRLAAPAGRSASASASARSRWATRACSRSDLALNARNASGSCSNVSDRAGDVLIGEPNAVLFRLRLGRGQFAFVDGALQQQPGGDLHQAGRQAHAFGRIGERRRARQAARFLAARSVEIGGGVFDQAHAFAEQRLERRRGGELGIEPDRVGRGLVERRALRRSVATPHDSLS